MLKTRMAAKDLKTTAKVKKRKVLTVDQFSEVASSPGEIGDEEESCVKLPLEASALTVDQFSEVASSPEEIGDEEKEPCVTGEPMSSTVQAWHGDLLKLLNNKSPPPKVTKATFGDATKLFGTKFDTKVTLRKAGHQGADEDIILVQFDPNFMSSDVICRHPSCNFRNPEAAKRGKRDLYLCPHHRQVLRNSISNALAKKNISIATSDEKPEAGRFAGYTSLISLLEGAYHDAQKFQTLEGKSPMVQEAILNVRNFLIVTSTVLNPNGNNLELCLPPAVQILRLLLENADTVPPLLNDLVYVLREVTEMILFVFGVVYTWVSLAPEGPGAQIGAGVGGVIGGVAGLVFGPWTAAAGVATGGVLGGLVSDGIYNLMVGDQKQQEVKRFIRDWQAAGGTEARIGQPNNPYPVYYFDGNAFGGLYLHPFPAVFSKRDKLGKN